MNLWAVEHCESLVCIWNKKLTPGPSKLEKVVDPGSGPGGPLPKSRFSRDITGRNFLIFTAKQHQVVDPGVHYQGPLPSPILTVQALFF